MPPHLLTERVFGKIDEHGGELAASTFLHLWFLPLLPTGSVWISSSSSRSMAQPIRWHWRSIAAGYLRTWAPLTWMVGFLVDSTAGYGFAAAGLALFVWAWSWRMAHRRGTRLRNDFDLVALGSQCPPEHLAPEDCEQLLASKQRDFAALVADRTPEDIARFGSPSTDELLAAYAVLRLAAALRRPSGPWRAAAQRIVLGRHDQPDASEGVFRSGAPPRRASAAALAEQVHGRARVLRASSVLTAARGSKTFLQDVLWGDTLRLVGYAGLGLLAFLGGRGLQDVRDPDQFERITERRLRDTIATGQTEYRVECEVLIPFLAASENERGDDVHLCQLGARLLPVLSEDGEGIRGTTVRGRLRPRHVFTRRLPFWERVLEDSPYQDRTPVVYLVTDVFSKVGQLALALSTLLGSLVLLILWERVRRQRAQMIAEAESDLAAG